jgi:hypothetical protein
LGGSFFFDGLCRFSAAPIDDQAAKALQRIVPELTSGANIKLNIERNLLLVRLIVSYPQPRD